ncbi:putative RNA recognition motif domain, nucleotide-binding alpha-beta plait domain superfamily [Helianthus annuus]|nr:putative RNA recognition motif domain, nucleotide-binding alpha-beta plait domain superfamily [Helianthus annuus]KAJ0506061.1 putative RNA recognition motif domain, nucleotide-binding alpha-beta plait domain superfamily [Helianthus annuus]KAJ0675731.1 putative RNA recognition motif domain, nucleotide-binding alpha-beta plait domain superfamily [Helianthus annuus]
MVGRDKMEEEWKDVSSKRNSKRGSKEQRKDNITKYYMTNLPFGCTPWEVAEFLGYYGEVSGTYVARKNDKEGKRFGFISFKNVKDAKELENRMNGVKMGKFILKVNIAKFAVENVGLFEEGASSKIKIGVGPSGKSNRIPEFPQQNGVGGNNLGLKKDGRSFAELFKGKGRERWSALVGRIVDINILNKLDRVLWDGGQTLAFERVAWFNVFGVPLHLADNSVFNEIASQFGNVVKPAQLSIDDDDLSSACVGVLVGDGKEIKENINLKWKNKSYQVWISEVCDVWIPECMGVVGLKNVDRTEESPPQSPELDPVEGVIPTGNEEARAEEEMGTHEVLHGNTGCNPGNQSNIVGPEDYNQDERESGGFVCSSVDSGKRRKRRPKLRSPGRDRPNNLNKSPVEEERPNKRPRES